MIKIFECGPFYWLSLESQRVICIQSMSMVREWNSYQVLEIKDYQCKAHGRTEILSCLFHTHICNTKANALSTQKMVWKLDRLCMNWFFHGGLYCYHKPLDHANFILRLENDDKHRYEKTIMAIFYVLNSSNFYIFRP